MLLLLLPAIAVNAQIGLTLSEADQESLTFTHTYPSVNDIIVRYGSTAPLNEEIIINNCPAPCSFQIEDLDPASFYFVEIRPASNPGFVLLEGYFSTSSLSSGEIKVYFTREIDSSISTGSTSNGNTGEIIESTVIQLINEAQSTIDVTMYNINRRPIADALSAAHGRGVRVRYITGDDTSNSALRNPDVPFPVLEGNEGDPLMHNKFLIFDAADPNRCQLITGATNFTEGQVFDDYNNMVIIQDQSVARIFELEFEEMWGASGALPDTGNSRFGSSKTDNTPHQVKVGDIWMEIYFSPSDQTSFQIDKQLRKAQNDISVALLLLTRNELATALLQMHQRGIEVRGLVNNVNDIGSDFSFLQANGVDIWQHDEGVILHHKYAIIDAISDVGSPVVITGSHNWTTAAEEINDENTVIIQDGTIANIFLQEFQARWCETRPESTCRLTSIDETQIQHSSLKGAYESSSSSLHIFSDKTFDASGYSLYDMQGRIIMGSKSNLSLSEMGSTKVEFPALSPGVYFVKVDEKENSHLLKFMVGQ
jgi:phosphatidylserine/phosphatidylglycerophosphate/cardiolipin synthase-like enzyme